ncbi:MAG: hypothetical protein IPO65_12920 [Saprospiraceae bacterium]|nr:hypothetical protein [Saprospiraceae bacterium]
MIKLSLYFALLLCTFKAQGQTGVYVRDEFLNYVSLTLEKDSTFKFIESFCVGNEVGSGKYSIVGNQLILKYDSLINPMVVYHTSKSNDVELTIHALDEKSGKVIENIELNEVLITGEYPDIITRHNNGKHIYKRSFDGPKSYSVSSSGYSSHNFYVANPGTYEIYVKLSKNINGDIFYKYGVETYDIKELSLTSLTLLSNGFEFKYQKRN